MIKPGLVGGVAGFAAILFSFGIPARATAFFLIIHSVFWPERYFGAIRFLPEIPQSGIHSPRRTVGR